MAEESKATDESSENKTSQTKQSKKRASKKSRKRTIGRKRNTSESQNVQAKYPRHLIDRSLRIPRAILEQNAGKECSDAEAAGFLGFKLTGEIKSEIGSAIKYGFLERPNPRRVKLTELGRKVLRPHEPKDEIEGFREAILKAPEISDVYKHYRGENLPDQQFFDNALVDKFHIPQSKLSEFKTVFIDALQKSKLLEEHNGKQRVIDISKGEVFRSDSVEALEKLGKTVSVSANDSCFVVMPFAKPLGDHYSLIYEQAIKKAGLRAVRADDIFATGKVMDQIWAEINSAKVLVAELTSRNPNVFYELGIAHTLGKPVVLVSSNEDDVPFDVRHIRVIYYDVNDPFWGDKLISKVAENILSAIKDPEEATFRSSENK